MSKILLAFCLALVTFNIVGQTCIHSDLSKSLLFKTEVKRVERTGQARASRAGYSDSCIIKITVVNKTTKKLLFSTTYSSNFLYQPDFSKCNTSKSYTTGTRQNADVLDWDYGDFLVADFNFDGREDFAAKSENTNGGVAYNYYVQNITGSFKLDKFLTERMRDFPTRIDKPAKTLIWETNNGRWYFRTIYRLNTKTARWRKVRYKPVLINTNPIGDEMD